MRCGQKQFREIGETGGIRRYFLLNLPHLPYLNKEQPLMTAPVPMRLGIPCHLIASVIPPRLAIVKKNL
jgi:hypothetical protein